MAYFWHILLSNIIPLSVMIALGALLQRAFRLDIRTLSKLNFYLFSPAVMFTMLYESELSLEVFLQVLGFFGLFWSALWLTAELAVRFRRYDAGMRSAMRNSVVFYNSANYAIPLNQLVFAGNPSTMSVQLIIMMMQNILPNTYGVYSVNAHKGDWRSTLRTVLSMPTLYAIPAALILRAYHVPVPAPIYTPLSYIADAFIATALITLGVQLGGMKWKISVSDVALSCFLRLAVGPALGFAAVFLLSLMGDTALTGDMARSLVLSCAVPTSLSSVLLAVEFDNEPDFASQAVFTSTVLSIFTVTFVIYLLQFMP